MRLFGYHVRHADYENLDSERLPAALSMGRKRLPLNPLQCPIVLCCPRRLLRRRTGIFYFRGARDGPLYGVIPPCLELDRSPWVCVDLASLTQGKLQNSSLTKEPYV